MHFHLIFFKLPFSHHWKLTDMQYSGFIASPACIHTIMEHVDDVKKFLTKIVWLCYLFYKVILQLLWLGFDYCNLIIINYSCLFFSTITEKANYFVLGKADHHAHFSWQTVYIRAIYVSVRHTNTLNPCSWVKPPLSCHFC